MVIIANGLGPHLMQQKPKKQGKDEQIAVYLPSLFLLEVLTRETLLPVFERPLVVVSIATVNWS